MSALELTNAERKRAETNCPYCRAKIVPQLGNGFKPYECGTGYMGYPQSSNCRKIQLTRLTETEFRQHLLNAVNASCSCGGGALGGCCRACEVWHRFVQSTEEGKWDENTFHEGLNEMARKTDEKIKKNLKEWNEAIAKLENDLKAKRDIELVDADVARKLERECNQRKAAGQSRGQS